MTSQPSQATPADSAGHDSAPTLKPPRIWPAALLLGVFWTVFSVVTWTELGVTLGFAGFLLVYGACALTTLLIAFYWLGASRVRWAERLGVFGVVLLAGIVATFLADRSALPFMLMPGLPLVLTACTLALIGMRQSQSSRRGWAICGVACLAWSAFLLVRTQGVGGDFQPALHWRWTPTAEQEYLAGPAAEATLPVEATSSLTLRPGDWAGFRGADRDGIARDVRIATDWDATPPKLLWRRRIGPAWSSIAVVGDRLFTQEQLGPQEAVVSLEATTGKTLWSHQDTARHDDGQGEAGPRATPTFAEGRIFALGATGILNCLDAETGERKWFRDIMADAATKRPVWGFSSSPLVVGDLVVVFAGSEASDSQKTLLAYRTDSGELAWSAAAGNFSYSSPQLATIGDEAQLLFVSEAGLFAFDPTSGAVVWRHPAAGPKFGIPRTVQPRTAGENRILFDAGADLGTALIELTHDGKKSWSTNEHWVSRQLKPSFNDFVVHNQSIYGFEGRMLTCVDLETGKRRWKGGRYGSGQVLLLGDQELLVVVTEEGEIVLVPADPNKHRELARLRAVEGKTWNHPVIAHGRLYVRNAQVMACYELPLAEAG